ncbi:DNA repair XRCC1-like, partial [Brachionus plicatilis]
MSLIKIKSILSFSSEDTTSKSENIINRSGKWIGSKSGDTKQFIKIELSEPSLIKQIDIENESSAFIEILVGNLNYLDEDFEVLLQATSFMSPNESKNSLNTNRLKIFTHETDLDEKLAEKKWEVIKIVCTQPFNTNLQFGISSLKFYDGIVNEASREAAKINTGIFSLKKEVSSSEKTTESEF